MERVRLVVPAALADWGLWHLCDDVRMCAAELVVNAIIHATRPVGTGPHLVSVCLRYWLGSALRLEVADEDPRMPREQTETHVLAEQGRGLIIVSACSDGWWAQRSAEGGKVVCCRWELSGQGIGGPDEF